MSDLSALTKLKRLDISEAGVSGELDDLGALSGVTEFYVAGNALEGNISPAFVGKLSKDVSMTLRRADVPVNVFSGCIPHAVKMLRRYYGESVSGQNDDRVARRLDVGWCVVLAAPIFPARAVEDVVARLLASSSDGKLGGVAPRAVEVGCPWSRCTRDGGCRVTLSDCIFASNEEPTVQFDEDGTCSGVTYEISTLFHNKSGNFLVVTDVGKVHLYTAGTGFVPDNGGCEVRPAFPNLRVVNIERNIATLEVSKLFR